LKQLDPRPKHDLEVLVVDNNSSDGTADLVRGLIPEFPFKLRYIFEGRQGLSAARNRAIDEAQGDYLAFLDDECTVDGNWLAIGISDIEEFHPPFIGGPYIGAFLPGDIPKWFKIEYGDAHFIGAQYGRGFQREFRASGGNMLVRRDVFSDVRFDVNLGVVGNLLRLGEEIDLQDRFLTLHPTEAPFYEPQFLLRHFIRPEKITLFYGGLRTYALELSNPDGVDLKSFLTAFCKLLGLPLISPVRCLLRDRKKYPFWQNYFYERAIPRIGLHSGIIVKYLRSITSDR
jgi:glycosyltransferase involved in cell wall biosynthesis